MDRGFVYTCVLLLFTAATLGCAGGQQTIEGEITFEQLFSNPGAYNGRYIILEGFYFHGWEISVLCETLELSGYAQGHLVPNGGMIWVEGGMPKEIYDRLDEQQMMGPSERYGKIRVKGKFEYGGEYGHAGEYICQKV